MDQPMALAAPRLRGAVRAVAKIQFRSPAQWGRAALARSRRTDPANSFPCASIAFAISASDLSCQAWNGGSDSISVQVGSDATNFWFNGFGAIWGWWRLSRVRGLRPSAGERADTVAPHPARDQTTACRPAFRAKRGMHPVAAIPTVMPGMDATHVSGQRTTGAHGRFPDDGAMRNCRLPRSRGPGTSAGSAICRNDCG